MAISIFSSAVACNFYIGELQEKKEIIIKQKHIIQYNQQFLEILYTYVYSKVHLY